MDALNILLPLFANSMSEVICRYGMEASVVDESRISLKSALSKIVFIFGRDPQDISIFMSSTASLQRVNFLYVILLRNDFSPDPVRCDPSLSVEENVSRLLRDFQRKLIAHCDDLLRGDFSVLFERDKYFEFEEFMKGVYTATATNPTDKGSIRFRQGDWSYVRNGWREKSGQ